MGVQVRAVAGAPVVGLGGLLADGVDVVAAGGVEVDEGGGGAEAARDLRRRRALLPQRVGRVVRRREDAPRQGRGEDLRGGLSGSRKHEGGRGGEESERRRKTYRRSPKTQHLARHTVEVLAVLGKRDVALGFLVVVAELDAKSIYRSPSLSRSFQTPCLRASPLALSSLPSPHPSSPRRRPKKEGPYTESNIDIRHGGLLLQMARDVGPRARGDERGRRGAAEAEVDAGRRRGAHVRQQAVAPAAIPRRRRVARQEEERRAGVAD